MTQQELTTKYENEVAYQKHMIRNLGYWFELFLLIVGIGVVLTYFAYQKMTWLFVIGIVLATVGVCGMWLFGYAAWRGTKNVQLVIADYERKKAKTTARK